MKKLLLFAIMFCGIIVCGVILTACSSPFSKPVPTAPSPPPTINLSDLDRVDSSTGAYPMVVAIANNALGTDNSDKILQSSQTVQAIKNVIDGTKDIAIAPMPGQEQLDYAKQQGVDLDYVHVADNAFVFLVSEDNPVDNLTTQQIKGIYSGKITNWKQVGGKDAKIAPLQRNADSGSQTAMVEFMGSQKLMSPITDYTESTMGFLIAGITKPFDGTQSAIGYSFLYYVKQMVDVTGIKLLGVDGVVPSDETIIDGTYPDISPYYAIIRKNDPEDGVAKRWAAYMTSETGQNVIEQAKYVRALLK